MVSVTVIIASIVISMVVTIGITLCCRFCSDYIETFIISVPKSLSENITKLRDTQQKITAMNHPKKNDWLSKVERTLEGARLLILQEYSSSDHNDDDGQRSYFCFGYYHSSPIKLQREVKRLIVKGQGIIAASAKVVAPDIESGIIAQEYFEIMRMQIRPRIEEGSTIINETSEQVIVHIPGISDAGEGNGNRKQLELKQTCRVPDVEEGKSLELTGEQIPSHIEEGNSVDGYLEQAVVQSSGVQDTEEGTSSKKQLELQHTGGFPDIEEGVGGGVVDDGRAVTVNSISSFEEAERG